MKDGPWPAFFSLVEMSKDVLQWLLSFFIKELGFFCFLFLYFCFCLFVGHSGVFFVILFSGFFRELRWDCSLVLLCSLGFFVELLVWFFFFQLVPGLNYQAQLLLATILAARSSAWLILIQLVCWQTEFCAILNALSGL